MKIISRIASPKNKNEFYISKHNNIQYLLKRIHKALNANETVYLNGLGVQINKVVFVYLILKKKYKLKSIISTKSVCCFDELANEQQERYCNAILIELKLA